MTRHFVHLAAVIALCLDPLPGGGCAPVRRSRSSECAEELEWCALTCVTVPDGACRVCGQLVRRCCTYLRTSLPQSQVITDTKQEKLYRFISCSGSRLEHSQHSQQSVIYAFPQYILPSEGQKQCDRMSQTVPCVIGRGTFLRRARLMWIQASSKRWL